MAITMYQRASRIALICFVLAVSGIQAETVLYVDKDATGPEHNGSSWCCGHLELYDALRVAVFGDTIRVADGTYTPDPTGLDDPREATFHIVNGVTIEGGYAGCGATDPDERDISKYETILSGDLNGDDEIGGSDCCVANGGAGCDSEACEDAVYPHRNFCLIEWDDLCALLAAQYCCDECNRKCENSFHVVTADETDDGTVLDGVTISAGFASEVSGGVHMGGGLRTRPGVRATVAHCTFRENLAVVGGAIFDDGQVDLIDCEFVGNIATDGGALYQRPFAQATLTDCVFRDNAAGHGGGMFIDVSQPTLRRCTFISNFAGYGGAVYLEGLHQVCGIVEPTILDSTFVGNTAMYRGGALYVADYGEPTIVQSIFSGNSAERWGGAVYFTKFTCRTTFLNSTLSGNAAGNYGGGIYAWAVPPQLRNSILWANRDSYGTRESSQMYIDDFVGLTGYVNYSCIQGLTASYGGTGNVDDDPLFIDADGLDGIVGTPDDDVHLSVGSLCADAGDPDTEDLPDLDFDGDARVCGCRVDMGIDETTTFADCNGNGSPDACDIREGISEDCTGNRIPDECEPDCNGNEIADTCDLASGVSIDCNANEIPDECDLDAGLDEDCNGNAWLDGCELEGFPLLFDDFTDETIDPDVWSVTGDAFNSYLYFVSPPRSLRTRSAARVESTAVDLSQALFARLTYYWLSRSPWPERDLAVSYWDGITWQTVAIHPGGVEPLAEWQAASFDLPRNARHAEFRLRFEGAYPGASYYWYIDDVAVVVSTPDCNGSGRPDVCEPFGDFEMDEDWDLTDFARLQLCFTGDDAPLLPPCCATYDFMPDGDVDLEDAAEFTSAMTDPQETSKR
ncbi:MAG: right-handed parallel beta-helix repeat-containing protein [Phycisphaerae bacterium]